MVVIRAARPADVAALGALARAAYQHYVPRIGREPAPMTADYAAAVAAGQVWVAERDRLIVGFVVLIPESDCLLVENVAVRPGEQGGGIGRMLMAHAETIASQQDRSELRLYTNELMTENLTYYPRLGYVETHRAEQHGFRRVFFRKPL